ncbi:hypothetical protein BH10ACI3_BH10ACI3_24760 [soil metagenome]
MKSIFRIVAIGIISTAFTLTLSAQSSSDFDAFLKEAKYPLDYITTFLEYYDPNLTGGSSILKPSTPAEWTEFMDRLALVDNLCRTKYTNLPEQMRNIPATSIIGKPKTWCRIAANRLEYEKKARGAAVDDRAESFIKIWRYDIEKVTVDPKGWVSDIVQSMLFDPKWKTEKFAEIQAVYKREGLGEPSMTMFDTIKPDLDKVRAIIDRTSSSNAWEKPPYTDAAVETYFKTKFVVHPYYVGSTVLKIGGNYTTWRVFKNSLGIPTNQYKRGLFLTKRAGQGNLCQIREWIVKQEYVGGGRFGPMKVDSNGGGGTYAKCQ